MRPPVPGDVVWVDFNPASGHEQTGLRPAQVLSAAGYNASSSFVVVCPITSSSRPWPWKVAIPPVGSFRGVVLVDQVKSIDRPARIRRIAGKIPADIVGEVRAKLAQLLELAPSDAL